MLVVLLGGRFGMPPVRWQLAGLEMEVVSPFIGAPVVSLATTWLGPLHLQPNHLNLTWVEKWGGAWSHVRFVRPSKVVWGYVLEQCYHLYFAYIDTLIYWQSQLLMRPICIYGICTMVESWRLLAIRKHSTYYSKCKNQQWVDGYTQWYDSPHYNTSIV